MVHATIEAQPRTAGVQRRAAPQIASQHCSPHREPFATAPLLTYRGGMLEMQSSRVRERIQMHQPQPQPDHEVWDALLTRIGAGDQDALADLYGQVQRPLFRYLCQLTPDPRQAEEILQETLFAIWNSAGGFEGRSSARTWVFGVARRQAHNALRRHGVELAGPDALDEVADPEPLPEDRALARVEIEEIARGIARLAPLHREVLVLTFVHGLAYSETAEITGAPVGTVKSRLSNAKRALRAVLER